MSRADDDAPAETTHSASAASALRALESDVARTVNLTRRADAPSLGTPSIASLARALAGTFFPSRKNDRTSALALHRNPRVSAAARLDVATAAREAGVRLTVFL